MKFWQPGFSAKISFRHSFESVSYFWANCINFQWCIEVGKGAVQFHIMIQKNITVYCFVNLEKEKIMQLQGIISGKHIELFHETNLPDGLLVTVDIQAKPLSLEEKRKLVDKLCGSWSEDNSLKQIFTEIENQRNSKLRECNMTIQIIEQKNGELREMLCPDKRDSFSKENWFRIVAALDNIGDTASGMGHYEEKGIGQEPGEKYIKIFGLLQSIYLQQDSIRELYKLIIGSWDKPDESSAWKYLRDVRNRVAGHPAERGGAISRMTLSDDGFKIGYWDKSSDDNFLFEYVPLKERYEEYIQEVDVMLERLKKAVG